MADELKVTTSTRLWSEEVALASVDEDVIDPKKEPGYEWSNGRKFNSGDGIYVP